jgi:putative membrane protein
MRLLFRFILQIAANAVAIAIAAYFIPQITFNGSLVDYAIVGAILAVANLIVKPILKAITAPLIFITLGLFVLVINAAILFGIDWFVEELVISGLWGYVWATIIISILNAIIVGAGKRKR